MVYKWSIRTLSWVPTLLNPCWISHLEICSVHTLFQLVWAARATRFFYIKDKSNISDWKTSSWHEAAAGTQLNFQAESKEKSRYRCVCLKMSSNLSRNSFLGVKPPLKLQLRCRACKQAPFTQLCAVNKHIKACIQITRKANFPELHVTENPSAHTRGCVDVGGNLRVLP